ncbi:MAG: ribonuclease P protein component [Candidatus Manganitrophaceae bacterium]
MGEELSREEETKAGSALRQYKKIKLRRLSGRKAVQTVFQKGKKTLFPAFVLFALKTDEPDLSYAIHVRKKLGTAVERNRIKRIYREVLQGNKVLLQGHHLIVLPRAGSQTVRMSEVADQIVGIFSRK